VKLRLDQLAGALRKGLVPAYLICGDEPLQLGEAADAIRQAAAEVGFTQRELFYADQGFVWSALLEAGDSFSLFGDKRIIDLRLPAKPEKEGAAALMHYLERPPEDAVLVVSMPKLTAAEQKSRWFQMIEQGGVVVQVWPLEGQKLIEWLDRRMSAKKMLADQSGLRILAARVEGNLLAAAQEIEKLHILYGSVRIEDEMIRKAVADSARYDVFELAEAALHGQTARAWRILFGLRAEGVAPAVALWALSRELRILAGVKALTEKGETQEAAFAKQKERVWEPRKTSLVKALQRLGREDAHQALLLCARADRTIKGMEAGEPWDALLDVCLSLTGKPTRSPRTAFTMV
jgi:DNA polymerase-3 subunit delta